MAHALRYRATFPPPLAPPLPSRPPLLLHPSTSSLPPRPVVARLLAQGHSVRACVRDPKRADHVDRLRSLPGGRDRLSLFQADLLTPGSYDGACAGADWVFHIATPYINGVSPSNADQFLMRPALEGLRNVLGSVDRAVTVTRLVVTSSMAAISEGQGMWPAGHVVTETDWNDTDVERGGTPDATPLESSPYIVAKVRQERLAWELYALSELKKRGGRMVCVNPGEVGSEKGRVGKRRVRGATEAPRTRTRILSSPRWLQPSSPVPPSSPAATERA